VLVSEEQSVTCREVNMRPSVALDIGKYSVHHPLEVNASLMHCRENFFNEIAVWHEQ